MVFATKGKAAMCEFGNVISRSVYLFYVTDLTTTEA